MTESVGFNRVLGELSMGKRPIQLATVVESPAKRRRVSKYPKGGGFKKTNTTPSKKSENEIQNQPMTNVPLSPGQHLTAMSKDIDPSTIFLSLPNNYAQLGEIQEVKGANMLNDKLMLHVKFTEADDWCYVPAEFANNRAPQAVIKFYQSRLCSPSTSAIFTAPPVMATAASPLITVVQQPPAKAVYQRLLKPFPAVALAGIPDRSEQFYVEATLLHSGTKAELDFLVGGKTLNINPDYPTVFKKLKITTTSQRQGTLFRLCFKLKRYENEQLVDVPGGTITTVPIEVFSHTTYLKKEKTVTHVCPSITRIIPDNGPLAGGNTVAVLGTALGSGSVRELWFGSKKVSVQLHDVSTLLCTVPKGMAKGEIVAVRLHDPREDYASEGALSYHYC
mmetsp:Transcript_4314/g.4738  ORF Transcript_4314/g.4738 Transcript_4314/m.4738 type:complete len:392 (+) Transcript_4314:143-1318(+)